MQITSLGYDDFILKASLGLIPGVAPINKFGRAVKGIQSTATDVWDRADSIPTQQIWTAPTQARPHTIRSTDANDDAAGTGARTLRLYGLTSWSAEETYEDISMSSGSGVGTVNSYVIIHRVKVLTKGSGGTNAGVITVEADTDATVTAQINAGEGQTQMAIYGIPSSKALLLTDFYGTINKSSGTLGTINFSLVMNPEPDSELTGFIIKNTRGLQTTGNSAAHWPFNPWYRIDGPAIVKVQGIASTSDMEASAGFNGFVVSV